MIRLEVPATEHDKLAKNYSFDQLVDLRDKLTLVVGRMKDQQEVIRYFEDVSNHLIE